VLKQFSRLDWTDRLSANINQAISMSVKDGTLPVAILTELDRLVDRLNASSGFNIQSYVCNNAINSDKIKDKTSIPPIRALLVSTDGVGLSRSFGSTVVASHMSEEILSSLETVWATLPSAGPSVMAGTSNGEYHTQLNHQSCLLLRPLKMGDEVRISTAFYDNCTLIHVHMSPLVVTILTTPNNTNIGAIRSTALPLLKRILDPVKKAILSSRRDTNIVSDDGSATSNVRHQQQLPYRDNSNDFYVG